ncbi:MAG TPA: group III truncated hemoglobin [Sphingomicrobium sp.]|nr:group III truncated hemoglobin [Sphingomicrobium sp.]
MNVSTAPDACLTDEQLSNLVDRFYAKVREDVVLGPVFNQAVDDWPAHLDRLSAFWSSIMLTSGRYKGNPMAVHLKHREAIRPAMFSRWLELWAQTASETLSQRAAAGVIEKAGRIAESLQLGLFFRLNGNGPGER